MCCTNRDHQHLDNYFGESVMSIESMNQEPVGEIVQAFDDLVAVSIPVMPPVGTKLYAAPQRQWVGLTEEEMFSMWLTASTATVKNPSWSRHIRFWKAIEAKLKEKNT